MNLTIDKIDELFTIIDRNNMTFLASQIGEDFLSKKDKILLKNSGIDLSKLPKQYVLDNAFKFGIIASSIGDERTKQFTYNSFKKFIADNNYIPLNSNEKAALDFIKSRLYNDIKGLGNKYSQKLGSILIEKDRKKRILIEGVIRDKSIAAVQLRKDKKWLASEIRNATKDYERNFERIADYILHEAYSQGRIASMLKEDKAEEVEVYFMVNRAACKQCKGAYLHANGKPKIFKLSTIINNGTNIGRKQNQWLPVSPPLHPNCRCEIVKKRKGYTTSLKPNKPKRDVLSERGVRVRVKVG
jgi:hypothetical protein